MKILLSFLLIETVSIVILTIVIVIISKSITKYKNKLKYLEKQNDNLIKLYNNLNDIREESKINDLSTVDNCINYMRDEK